MARSVLIDTNHLSELMRPVSRIRKRFEDSRRAGVRFGCCNPVLCELESIFRPPGREVAFRKTLGKLLERISRWTLDDTTARLYGEAFRELRDKGRALSQVDIMLVALTRQMDLTLLTSDRDFEAVPDIRTENWLT